MRHPHFLYTALFVSLSGCVTTQQPTQPAADQWVDEQIATSATAISLAQQRLHTTSVATQATSLTGPATGPAMAVVVPAPNQPAIATPPRAVSAQGVTPPKTFPVTPAPAPTIINVVAAPAVPAVTPSMAPNTGMPASIRPVVGTPAVPMSALIPRPAPAAPVPKPTPPPKPTWEARPGESLQQVITRWSRTAGYTLDWRAEGLDYPIDAPLRFQGSYEEAVSSIFKLYEKAERAFAVDGRRRQHRLIVNEELNNIRRAPK